jgi:nitroreductase
MLDVLDAIRTRASTRAFLDQPVDRATIESILDTARWAPSGVNAQPWQVAIVTGATRKKISAALLAARQAGEPERPDYRYYPEKWEEPYRARRIACGIAMYKALGIGREDSERKLKSWNANYSFFGAPIGLFFFVDRTLAQGAWVDYGMFIENVMLAALGHGLATCPQAALAEYPDLVRNILAIPDTRALICGMSLGYPDRVAPVNNYRTTREPVTTFTNWFD